MICLIIDHNKGIWSKTWRNVILVNLYPSLYHSPQNDRLQSSDVQLAACGREGLSHLRLFVRGLRPAGALGSLAEEHRIKVHFEEIINYTFFQAEKEQKKRRRPRRSQSERRVRNRTLTERDVKHLERRVGLKSKTSSDNFSGTWVWRERSGRRSCPTCSTPSWGGRTGTVSRSRAWMCKELFNRTCSTCSETATTLVWTHRLGGGEAAGEAILELLRSSLWTSSPEEISKKIVHKGKIIFVNIGKIIFWIQR